MTNDEKTVLLIAAKGEPMMPIGRWRAPAEALVGKKYLKPSPHDGDPTGFFNLRITAAGRQAVEEIERGDDEALRDMVMLNSSIQHEQRKLRATAEQIAVHLVDLATATQAVTGEPPATALENWALVICKRALEMVK